MFFLWSSSCVYIRRSGGLRRTHRSTLRNTADISTSVCVEFNLYVSADGWPVQSPHEWHNWPFSYVSGNHRASAWQGQTPCSSLEHVTHLMFKHDSGSILRPSRCLCPSISSGDIRRKLLASRSRWESNLSSSQAWLQFVPKNKWSLV